MAWQCTSVSSGAPDRVALVGGAMAGAFFGSGRSRRCRRCRCRCRRRNRRHGRVYAKRACLGAACSSDCVALRRCGGSEPGKRTERGRSLDPGGHGGQWVSVSGRVLSFPGLSWGGGRQGIATHSRRSKGQYLLASNRRVIRYTLFVMEVCFFWHTLGTLMDAKTNTTSLERWRVRTLGGACVQRSKEASGQTCWICRARIKKG